MIRIPCSGASAAEVFRDVLRRKKSRVDPIRSGFREIPREETVFTILLSHRPELFPVYAAHGLDLVFSGHAHGGQMQIPFVGGLIAPNQGFFPKYHSGLYTEGSTNMIVSRGIGNSLIPLRVNNRPEVIVAELKSTCQECS